MIYGIQIVERAKRASIRLSAIGLLGAIVCSCANVGDTTSVSTATGGVIGAGLGAIVGNQTGNTGSGLVIGALAGSGAGAMVGNALESQELAIQTQDEAIERQEQVIRAQSEELKTLRRLRGESGTTIGTSNLNSAKMGVGKVNPTSFKSTQILEKSLGESDSDGKIMGSYSLPKESLARNTSQECIEADGEAVKASGATEASEKLFHYRRALRLCPDKSSYHSELGKIYLSLNRKDDAKFEFQEAVRLDSGNAEAVGRLNDLAADVGNSY